MKKGFIIAIDGPVGSGKGTLALSLSKKIGATFIYTGAMYRELAFACLRDNVDLNNEKKILEVLKRVKIELKPVGDDVGAFLNGEDVSAEIFKPSVSNAASIIATLPKVREEMVSMQKKLAEDVGKEKSVIMEGRDIATVVAPNADLKVFLTANLKTRTKRRFDQFKEKGINTTLEEVSRDVEDRDKKDIGRKASPLKITDDSVVIDTTNDSITDTVNKVLEKLKEKELI